MFELAINTISKNSVIFKVFLKKILKFELCYWVFSFRIIFIWMLLLNYCFAEKQNSKKNLFKPVTLNNLKIIFMLLAKTVAF